MMSNHITRVFLAYLWHKRRHGWFVVALLIAAQTDKPVCYYSRIDGLLMAAD